MTAKPKLLIISFSDISKDARVLKQVRAFEHDYDVTTCGFGPSPSEFAHHVGVSPDGGGAHVADRVVGALGLILARIGLFAMTHSGIPYVRSARRLLAGQRFDVALANDVDTVAIAIDVTRRGAVHADLHEFFPGLHGVATEEERRQTAYYKWLVRHHVARSASSTTVGRGIATAYREYGLDPGVVTNATPHASLKPGGVESPMRLVHSGNAQPSRQLEIIMDAVAGSNANVSLDLLLMPNDLVYLDQLKKRASTMAGRVNVLDPVAQSDLVTTLNRYDVGIHVLPPTSFNNENALPNKFFDYVQARLGLLIGPSPEMASVLGAHGFGAVAAGFSTNEVRELIDDLTPEKVGEWKHRADLAADALSAESQVQVWVDAIARLVAESD